MIKTAAIVISLLVALAIIVLILQNLQTDPQSNDFALVNSPQDRKVAARSSESPQVPVSGLDQFESRFERPQPYALFDFSSTLSSSLRDAALGSAAAQHRAAVLLRDCRNAHMKPVDIDNLKIKGLADDHINLIKDRAIRCKGVVNLPPDASIASQQLSEEALQQRFPVAVADHLISTRQSLPANEIDDQLLAALSVAGDDRVLRSRTFFLILAAMDKRASADGMEADPVVRNAWTLLHCRESWECDLHETKEVLRSELTVPSLNAAIDLAMELEVAMRNGDLSSIRFY